MNRIVLLIFIVLFLPFASSARPFFRGAEMINASGESEVCKIERDSSGNVILVGRFFNAAFFDDIEYTAPDEYADIFIQKRNHDGDVLFTKAISGLGSDTVTALTCSEDAFYILGKSAPGTRFADNRTLKDPTNSNLKRVAFVAKYDLDGNCLWLKSFAAPGDDNTLSINNIRYHRYKHSEFILIGLNFKSILKFEDELLPFKASSGGVFGVLALTQTGDVAKDGLRRVVSLFDSPGPGNLKMADFDIHEDNKLYLAADVAFESPEGNVKLAMFFKSHLSDTNYTNILTGVHTKPDKGTPGITRVELNNFGEPVITGTCRGRYKFENALTGKEVTITETTDSTAAYVISMTSDLQPKKVEIIDSPGADEIYDLYVEDESNITVLGVVSSDEANGENYPGGADIYVRKIDYSGESGRLIIGGSAISGGDLPKAMAVLPPRDRVDSIDTKAYQLFITGAFIPEGYFGTDTLETEGYDGKTGFVVRYTDAGYYGSVGVESFSARQGENTYIPVRIEGPVLDLIEKSNQVPLNLRIDIAYNSTLLYPRTQEDIHQFQIRSHSVDDIGMRRLSYILALRKENVENGNIFRIPVTTGLGNSADTPIFLTSAEFISSDFVGTDSISDGHFTLEDLKYFGNEPILIQPGGASAKITAAPNHMSVSGKFKVTFYKECRAEIFLSDYTGEKVLDIQSGDYDEDTYDFNVSGISLSPGYYFIAVLINNSETVSEKILIN